MIVETRKKVLLAIVALMTIILAGSPVGAQVILNDLATENITTSFDPTPAPDAPAGVFTIDATFTNISATSIFNPFFEVIELSGGNLLLNADGGPGGVGSTLTPILSGGVFAPGDSFALGFNIGLQTLDRFTVFVNLLGDLPSGNTPPVADAGPDQTVKPGDTVTLDGSGSSDMDGDPLTFSWKFVSVPLGSSAILSDSTAIMPTFVADTPGEYEAQLIVNDGKDDSAPDTVKITTMPGNTRPVADAGPDQKVAVDVTVKLDGSASSDVDGDPLTSSWQLVSVPVGSQAVLSDPLAVMPTFVTDVPGEYIAQLVVNDGMLDSLPDRVTISTENRPPVADAGPDQSVNVGEEVFLDGSGSFDPDGDFLTFAWSLTSVPTGSTATISDPNAEKPSFTADLRGSYVAQLIVNDGLEDSAPDTVTIATGNSRPIADAGPDQSVSIGETVTLDGSASRDPDQDPLTFKWAILSKPTASAASLDDPSEVSPSFVADVGGMYVIQLIVNDGQLDSAPDTVVISANTAPVADAGEDQTVAPDDKVTLDGSDSSDAENDPLTFQWNLVSVPDGSTAALSDSTAVDPMFVADLPGTYVAELIVNDGLEDSEPDTVNIEAGEGSIGGLACGDLISGSIDSAGEVDEYTFTGTAGDVVAVTITGAQMAAKVFAPSGAQVTGFFVGTQTVVTLPESGTYVVEVVGNSFVATGNYSLGLECIAPPSSDAVALSCGSLAPGSITAPSEADLFTFSGTAGDVVAVTITGAQMAAKVFAPSGAQVTGFFVGTQTVVTLPESGTYVVEVVGNSFVATGNYSLGLECIAPPSSDAVALSCGSLAPGSITAPSEADLFTFTGTAGDVVAVTITGAQMAAKVFAPSGAQVTGFFVGTQTVVTLPESGTYVVEVVGNSFVATGNYSLGLECIAPPSSDAVALSCGSLAPGSITAPSEADLFTFSGTAGDVVAVTITGAQMAAKVFAPSGAQVTGFFVGTQTVVTLPESGTYVVEVVGNSFVATGNYSLGLECIAPPSSDAVALSCGSLAPGSITAPSEADLFTFTGTAGDVVAVTITGAQMAAKVFAPSGAQVTGFFVGTQTVVTLPESGTYVVEVVGNSFVATGNYSLGLECNLLPQ